MSTASTCSLFRPPERRQQKIVWLETNSMLVRRGKEKRLSKVELCSILTFRPDVLLPERSTPLVNCGAIFARILAWLVAVEA